MTVQELNNHGLIASQDQKDNLAKLADVITQLETAYGKPFIVTSGLRSQVLQQSINPAVKNSAHITGEAVDMSDPDGAIYSFCIDNVDILINLGVYVESRTYTPRWSHLTIRPPKSGNRFFIP